MSAIFAGMVGLAPGTTAVVLLLAHAVGFAQSAASGTPPQRVSIAIKAGRVLEPRTGAYLAQQLIWIEGDRIKQVGSASDIAPHLSRGTRIIDLTSATVLPGLIDCHTHLTVSPETAAKTAAAASGPPKMDPPIDVLPCSVREMHGSRWKRALQLYAIWVPRDIRTLLSAMRLTRAIFPARG
jgi:hypothetical protein